MVIRTEAFVTTKGTSSYPGILIFEWAAFAATTLLSARLTYEQTILTWRDGWQMVGFSIAHGWPTLVIFGTIGALSAHIAFLILSGISIRALYKGTRIPRSFFPLAAALFISAGLLYIPYAGWITMMVSVMGPGGHGNSYLSFATSEHHPRLARLLIDRGVPVDAPYGDHTPLNGACVRKDVQMAKYLIARGARLGFAPECEWLNEVTGKPPRPTIPSSSITVNP